jgi:DNA replication and repair protein RecF
LHLNKIKLSNFRNLKDQSVDLQEGMNVLLGENGQGKTNFLEAIYFLATLRSFRSASVKDVIRFGDDQAEVSGQVDAAGIPIDLRVQLKGNSRRLWVGQRSVGAAKDFLGQLKVVAFTPDDLAMIKGGPALRRKFMDRAAFLFDPLHLTRIRDFNQALKSRNRLLRDGQRDGVQKELIDSFSQTMAESGAEVSRARMEVIGRVGVHAKAIVSGMTPGSGETKIEFEPGWEIGEGATSTSLLRQLRYGLKQDLRRGLTGIGPQQDDFDAELGGSSARKFASQGQQRIMAVALLLAVVQELIFCGGERPVILLDDVSSELDAGRRRMLFERVGELGGQVLVTTTDERLVDELGGEANIKFLVAGGNIQPLMEK